MKKQPSTKKLVLHRTHVRTLTPAELEGVQGGWTIVSLIASAITYSIAYTMAGD